MNDEGSPTWRLLSEQLEAAKGEISRLKALRNEGELNEKLKDPGYAAKVALAGLISERDELLLQNSELLASLKEVVADCTWELSYDIIGRAKALIERVEAKTEKRIDLPVPPPLTVDSVLKGIAIRKCSCGFQSGDPADHLPECPYWHS